MTKLLPISKRLVWNSYKKVVAKDGGAGIDHESIEMFNENMAANLYKLWYRMTSGVIFHQRYGRYLFPKSRAVSDL